MKTWKSWINSKKKCTKAQRCKDSSCELELFSPFFFCTAFFSRFQSEKKLLYSHLFFLSGWRPSKKAGTSLGWKRVIFINQIYSFFIWFSTGTIQNQKKTDSRSAETARTAVEVLQGLERNSTISWKLSSESYSIPAEERQHQVPF